MDVNSKNSHVTIQKGDYKLKTFIQRLEKLSEEKNNINYDIKEFFSEAKSMGYDPTIKNNILALRKIDIDEKHKQETLLKTFKSALGIY